MPLLNLKTPNTSLVMAFQNYIRANKYILRSYIKQALIIAIVWSLLDYLRFNQLSGTEDRSDFPFADSSTIMKLVRAAVGVIGNFFMAYVLIFPLAMRLRNTALWLGFIIKTAVMCLLAFVVLSVSFFALYFLVNDFSLINTWHQYVHYVTDTNWIVDSIILRLLVFVITLFGLEIADKYSPGVFTKIFFGVYVKPKEENRIIIFLDLINSTPIAERLGHKLYFYFIRDFIHDISTALLEYNGLIYQYVGDEIVVSWILNKTNKRKSIASLKRAQQIIRRKSQSYLKKYGVEPQFRAGIHCGTVTVGEIGIVKKDLAISGEAMNTTARIRSMTSKMDVAFLASADFVKAVGLSAREVESIGFLELKGKSESMELFRVYSDDAKISHTTA